MLAQNGLPPERLAACELPLRRGIGFDLAHQPCNQAHTFAVWKRDRVISLVNPENRRSIRVVERLGERLEGRTDLAGREMLLYGIDRETWLSRSRRLIPTVQK